MKILLKDESLRCPAVIWHGSGHQSKTHYYLTGKHHIHETIYGRYDQFARWRGKEVFTGRFDEPPDFGGL